MHGAHSEKECYLLLNPYFYMHSSREEARRSMFDDVQSNTSSPEKATRHSRDVGNIVATSARYVFGNAETHCR